MIKFKMIDHFADDAGFAAPTERIIIEALDRQNAIKKFCTNMDVASFEILSIEEVV
jgi:hypothetical protein